MFITVTQFSILKEELINPQQVVHIQNGLTGGAIIYFAPRDFSPMHITETIEELQERLSE